MEVLTPKAMRRSTRLRVEIPVSVISLDRMRPFGEKCLLLVVSAQGCGFRSSEALQVETPIMLSGLPGGGSVTARVANCLPLGDDGKYFLIGAALYTHGNVGESRTRPRIGISRPRTIRWQLSSGRGAHSAGERAKEGLANNLFAEAPNHISGANSPG